MQLPPDEDDRPPERPKTPCLVCETPTDTRPVCERFQLCLECFGAWLTDERFGADFEANTAATPAWLAERKKARAAA